MKVGGAQCGLYLIWEIEPETAGRVSPPLHAVETAYNLEQEDESRRLGGGIDHNECGRFQEERVGGGGVRMR